MTCDELRDDYAAYALGSASDPERSEIATHLARDCEQCTPGVRTALSATASMAAAVKVVEPPKSLRRRIIALVRPESGQSWAALLLPWGVAAGLAIGLILTNRATTARPQDQKLQEALSILHDPATRDVSFGEPAARGRVFVSSGKGVVLMAANLPVLEPGKTFELWLIPPKGNPIPAGTFDAEKDATAFYVRPGPVENVAALALTIEPSGGSPLPTTKPFAVTKL